MVKGEETEQLKVDLKELSAEFVQVDGFNFSFIRRLFLLLCRKDVDVIHSQGYSCGVLVSLVNMLFRTPHVITLHGTFDDTTIRGGGIWFKKQLIWLFLSRANVINVVSHDAKANLIDYFGGAGSYLQKIVVIQNGIDVKFFQQELEAGAHKRLTEIKGIEHGSVVVGYLGRFMPEKGFPVLIDAIELIAKRTPTDETVKVLALGWGAYIREYQASISEKGLNRFFVFIDFQPDVRWILRQLDMLIIPSFREAFPLVAVEALVCGTPIIASNCIGLREVLRDSPARMVKAGDPIGLAAAIMEMVKNSKRQEAVDYIPKALKRFDVSVATEKLDRLLREVVQSS